MNPSPSIQFRRPGLRSLLWALALVLLGALLGLGLNHVSSVGINMQIALGLDQPPSTDSGQAQPGVKP